MEPQPLTSNRQKRLRRLTPYLVLAAGLVFTLLVSYRLAKVAEAEDRARFQVAVQDVQARIARRLETYTALLSSAAGLFAASETVEEEEFRTFVKMLDLAEHFPGVQGMGFSMRLRPVERAAIIAARRREGIESFHLWPDAERDEYHAIIFLEPQDGRNQVVLGYDMFTEPSRRAPMERARDTGQPAASSRVTLFQIVSPQATQPGFLIYTPVYRNGQQPTNLEDRRATLLGFVFSAFRADDFFRGIVSGSPDEVDFEVYDGGALSPANLLHRSNPQVPPATHQPRFAALTNMDVSGRPWTINYSSRQHLIWPEARAGFLTLWEPGSW